MATSTETNVDLAVNSVPSDEMLEQMAKDGLLDPFNIFFTPDDSSGGGAEGGSGSGLIAITEDFHLMDLAPNIYAIPQNGSGFLAKSIKFYFDGSTDNSYINIYNGILNVTEEYNDYTMTVTKNFFGDVYFSGLVKDNSFDTRSGHAFIMGFGTNERGNCTVTIFDGNDVLATRTWVNNNTPKNTWEVWE